MFKHHQRGFLKGSMNMKHGAIHQLNISNLIYINHLIMFLLGEVFYFDSSHLFFKIVEFVVTIVPWTIKLCC